MTALTKYDRLEAAGLWRAAPDQQRIDVIVSLGDATLTIKDTRDQALAHWSLAAIARSNPGKRPALFHPEGDTTETLEIPTDEDEMIRAIEKLRKAVERARPKKGRLRGFLTLALLTAGVSAAIFLLPNAVVDQAIKVVPDVKRAEIGNALLTQMQRSTGKPCSSPSANPALVALTRRMTLGEEPTYLAVMRAGVKEAIHIPGGVILLSRTMVEDYESPDVLAGYIIAEQVRRETRDPLRHLLESAGLVATLRLLTTSRMPESAIEDHAKQLLTEKRAPLPTPALLARFETLEIPSSTYGYAVDVTGELTLPLIEGDPLAGATQEPVLPDSAWVRLQAICEG
jgi:enhancing lycopene biosynthesis protein 2